MSISISTILYQQYHINGIIATKNFSSEQDYRICEQFLQNNVEIYLFFKLQITMQGVIGSVADPLSTRRPLMIQVCSSQKLSKIKSK